ncbi:MAG TPA: polyprenyl diphosphate synthase [Actinomycetota bacterium]|nr:polyprenyl diphosphate synthase [Actinomycetota bacterium]
MRNVISAATQQVDDRHLARLAGARLPSHLAVIPDGNRRWAEERNLSVLDGHRQGFEVAKSLSSFCRRIGIHTVTIWAFSTENWRRSPDQVSALMALYEEWLKDLLVEALEEEVRVGHLGRLIGVPEGAHEAAAAVGFPDGLPPGLIQAINNVQEKTAHFERSVINLAINYGGADEIQRAVGRLVRHAQETGKDPSELDIHSFLDTGGQPHPNPDIVWRTSGEVRSSGFLPLQSAYAEMVFTPKYFPELGEDDVVDTVLEYSARARRFGE